MAKVLKLAQSLATSTDSRDDPHGANNRILLVREIIRQQQENACSKTAGSFQPTALHCTSSSVPFEQRPYSPPADVPASSRYRPSPQPDRRIAYCRTSDQQIGFVPSLLAGNCSLVLRGKKIMCMGLSPRVDVIELRESSSFAQLPYLLPYLNGLERASEDC